MLKIIVEIHGVDDPEAAGYWLGPGELTHLVGKLFRDRGVKHSKVTIRSEDVEEAS